MATIRMKKGDIYADIYDSEETIANAKNEGYVIVTEAKAEPKAEPKKEEPVEETRTSRRGRK